MSNMTIAKQHCARPANRSLFFDDFFTRDFGYGPQRSSWGTSPLVNISESKDSFVIDVAAPGLSKESFIVKHENDVLSISAEVKKEEGISEERFTRREFRYSSFRREFRLPDVVNAEGINAQYENGVLRVTLPKLEETKAEIAKTIEVK